MCLPPSLGGRSCSNMWHCETEKSAWEAYTHFSYNDVAHVGCRARYKLFDAGNSIVCEIGANGCEYFIMADLVPDVLAQEIKKVQASWEQACLLITPNELKKNFPLFSRRNKLSTGVLSLASAASRWLKQSGDIGRCSTTKLGGPSRTRSPRRIVGMVAVVVILSEWWSNGKVVDGVMGPLSNMPSMDNVLVGMVQGTLPQPHHMIEVGWMGL